MILFELMRAVSRRRATLKLTPDARQTRNLERFRELASFVREHSPWYRRIIDQAGIEVTTCVPEEFPILTSAMVRSNFDEIVTDRAIMQAEMKDFVTTHPSPRSLYLGRYHVVSSSGSTGLPAYYIHTTDELINGMSYGIFHRKLKPRTRTTFIGILGEHKMSTAVMSMMDKWPERLLFNTRNFDVRGPWTDTLEGLNKHRPQVVSAYKHVLMRLAEEARAGRLSIEPILLESGGEPLFRHERDFLRDTFRCEIANSYGSSEMNMMGLALNDWNSIHLFEDDLIFELDHDATYVTNLYNRALPLIRYRFDDILTSIEVQKTFLPFRSVSENIGRSQELISFASGEGDGRKFKIILFEDVDFSGIQRLEFQKRGDLLLGVGAEVFAMEEPERGAAEAAIEERLERLRADMRKHLDAEGFEDVRLEVYPLQSRSRQEDTGRKDALVLRPGPELQYPGLNKLAATRGELTSTDCASEFLRSAT